MRSYSIHSLPMQVFSTMDFRALEWRRKIRGGISFSIVILSVLIKIRRLYLPKGGFVEAVEWRRSESLKRPFVTFSPERITRCSIVKSRLIFLAKLFRTGRFGFGIDSESLEAFCWTEEPCSGGGVRILRILLTRAPLNPVKVGT